MLAHVHTHKEPGSFLPQKSAGDIFLFSVWHFNTGSTSYFWVKEKWRAGVPIDNIATDEKKGVASSFLLVLVGNYICCLNQILN